MTVLKEMETFDYEYVGFNYKMTWTGDNWMVGVVPGQHPAAEKAKHLRAAFECFWPTTRLYIHPASA